MMNKVGLKSLLIGVATTLAVAAGNAGVMIANADQNTRNYQQNGDQTSIVVVGDNGQITDHISASFVYADQGPAAMAAVRIRKELNRQAAVFFKFFLLIFIPSRNECVV